MPVCGDIISQYQNRSQPRSQGPLSLLSRSKERTLGTRLESVKFVQAQCVKKLAHLRKNIQAQEGQDEWEDFFRQETSKVGKDR